MDDQKLKNILEAILMSAGKPLTAEKLVKMFDDEPRPSISQVKKQLIILADDCQGRGIE
ncbi:MAG: SMC-Scp complex subunit ScpB, partial [Enterobacterales bacterium]|nr:SMC-Scp complex subunit ScpB [Enterobacterales bacterium]